MTSFFYIYWDTIIEVLLLWVAYYAVFLLLRGTAAEQVIKGLIIISLIVMVTRGLNLQIINWLLTRLLAISVIMFVIIFQPEIRRALARIGRFGIFTGEREFLDEVAKAATVLAKKKTGGLIAIERETGLRRYVESGVEIDSKVTSELFNTIFMPGSPLHDGGVIVSGQRVEAAACLFPLTQDPSVPKTMGTRHRAAIGLSEEVDAVVVVVSEETGDISIAVGGRIHRKIDSKNVLKFLEGLINPKGGKTSFFDQLKKINMLKRVEK